MYYIDDYRKQAIDKIIPYLIEFPEIVSIIEDSADRYQAIEDVLWKIADNFKVENSRGIFLNAHAHNEVVNLIYTDKAKDAFTYGTQYPETQAFGTGHFYSQASYISGISKDVSEDKLIRAVQEKIIQNNTNGTILEFIEAMKLHFNATSVNIYESYPLAISLMLSGEKLELSSSGNKEAIKKCLPACVSLNNLYVNDHLFDQFTYSNNSNYANDSRYPIVLGDSDYLYKYTSTAINLGSYNEEYVKINNPFYNANYTQNEIPFECICGQLTSLSNNGVLYSFVYNSTNTYKISLITKQIDNEYYFVLSKSMWDDTNSVWQSVSSLNTNIKAETNKDYTFLLSINRNSFDFFRAWIFDNIKLIGQNTLQDTSWVYNIIQNSTAFTEIQLNETSITYDTQNVINAEITNYTNDTVGNFSDFTYYCIFGGVLNNEGNIEINNESSHYYVTCYGEKNLLFNCLSNNNHIDINTNSTLQDNLTVKQSSYNYKKWHSNGRCLNIYNSTNNSSIRWGEYFGFTPAVQNTDLGRNIWYSLAYDGTKFVALGSNGYISTSTDGITWTTATQNSNLGSHNWRSLAYDGTKFVALGQQGYISTSTDGITWSTATQNSNLGSSYWDSLAYDETKFVALGGSGYISTSIDGITWSTVTQNSNLGAHIWRSLAYDGTKFVALGQQGYISTSTDGITWSTATQNSNLGNNFWYSLVYDGTKFVALGFTGYISTSTDGITWSTATYNSNLGNNSWRSLVYDGTKFILLGTYGHISLYNPLPSNTLVNSFELSFDLCLPINSSASILKGLVGLNTNLNISYDTNEQKLTITLPIYTSGNVESSYTIEVNLTNEQFVRKFNNLKIKYADNKVFIYIDNVLIKSEDILNVNVRYLNAMLELGPINAFIKNLIFNCNYTDNVNTSTLEYNLPLTYNLYEKNNLLNPTNYNARFLTTPQLIDNINNKDLFNNETLRMVNF